MSEPTPANNIAVAFVTDRGLSQKRPLNEDSVLSEPERGLFAVADGVGGAEAGEVASQTAVDVLKEAFRHRVSDGDDVEDLMELAIQRANSSIHQMANEHPRFAMMATTVVALHVTGHTATFGHVGDSRLYRLSPEGVLTRETEDHSIVEEEVRAGRMTPEQAANHPSKNVISRALGAESSVEVDMKSIEVEDGTSFLLCTDGITRHISDNELRDFLRSGLDLEAVCEAMKQRCYERGAEDNLTAVIVRIGTPKFTATSIDPERTVDARLPELAMTAPSVAAEPQTVLTPPSRIAIPGPPPDAAAMATQQKAARKGRPVLRFFVFLLFLAVAVGAFVGGVRYQQFRERAETKPPPPQPSPTPDAARVAFEAKRAAVDADPSRWLAANLPVGGRPMDSKDPEFLYLYGRASMQTGKHRDAMQAFDLALANLRAEPGAALPFSTEIKLAQASAALKLSQESAGLRSQETLMAEQNAARLLDELLGVKSGAAPK